MERSGPGVFFVVFYLNIYLSMDRSGPDVFPSSVFGISIGKNLFGGGKVSILEQSPHVSPFCYHPNLLPLIEAVPHN